MASESDDMLARPPSIVDRYYKKLYKTDVQGNVGQDQLILSHSNKVCVVCVANSHPIIADHKEVTKVDFEGQGWSRLENTVSGKNKRGAQWLERMAPLCLVTCSDGSVYTLCCCIKGQLVEINLNLISQPHLLSRKPSCEGYLAVILPGLKHFDREINRLRSEEAYQTVLANRVKKPCLQSGDKTVNPVVPADKTETVNPLVSAIQIKSVDPATPMDQTKPERTLNETEPSLSVSGQLSNDCEHSDRSNQDLDPDSKNLMNSVSEGLELASSHSNLKTSDVSSSGDKMLVDDSVKPNTLGSESICDSNGKDASQASDITMSDPV